MFIGEYKHTIDEKGRVAVPVKFRGKLSEGVVITRGLDNCLFVYSLTEWDKIAQQLADMPLSQTNARAFSRLMLAGAMEAEIDRQGRIIIPNYLRSFASISKNVVMAGLYNRIEVWDEKNWQEYQKKNESEVENIAEKLTDWGI